MLSDQIQLSLGEQTYLFNEDSGRFFNFSDSYPFHTERSNKIEQLRKPVYSKKIKQRKPKLSLPKTDFINTIYSVKNEFKVNNTTNVEQKKVTKSKSEFIIKKNKNIQSLLESKDHLTSNLIIEKLQYKKDIQNSVLVKKNNFMKLFEKITTRISSSPLIKVNNFQEKSQNKSKSFRKSINLKLNAQNISPKTIKKINLKQNIKIIDIVKQQDIQSSLIHQLGQLRKKRNSLGQVSQDKNENFQLVPKNPLFFMNYLKQKEKKQQAKKSSHINFIKSATQVIKIQENLDLKQTLLNRENQKNIFRSKISLEKLQKANKIFNSMKIQPW